MKLHRYVVKVPMEETRSQTILPGPGFCFMKFRKECFKHAVKVSCFVERKCKLDPLNVFIISESII